MKLNRVLLYYSLDVAAAALAFCISLYLRLGHSVFSYPLENFLTALGLFTAVCAGVFYATNVHRGVWRYVSISDIFLIVRAVSLAVLMFVPICFLVNRLEGLPRSLSGIVWFVLIGLMSGSRFLVRLSQEKRLDRFWQANRQGRLNVLLVGTLEEAELFVRATQHDRQTPYHVVGVLDDRQDRTGRQIHNVEVLGQPKDLPRVVEELREANRAPARLVLGRSVKRLKGQEQLLADAQALNLALAYLPSMALQEGNTPAAAAKPALRPIALEDLLGRPETLLDRQAITQLVHGKRVLVTGAGGTIGSELVRQVAALKPQELVLLDNSEFNLYAIDLAIREAFPALKIRTVIGDIRDRAAITRMFAREKPELVFHAAALKHVPMAEMNVRETVLTNVVGTRNVADACRASGTQVMVLISTDKAVRPTSVMGATKRVAEQYGQALDQAGDHDGSPTRFLTVRFGNVLGSTGSVVPRFSEQLAKGGPLTVTHPEITRYFMTVREAVELVLQASAHAISGHTSRGRIMVLDMGQPVKIADLARQMIRLAGLKPDEDVKITYTGLRPGEKMYEELFSASEQLTPAGVDGVLLAAAEAAPLPRVTELLSHLETLANAEASDDVLRAAVAALVPEFGMGEDAPRAAAHG